MSTARAMSPVFTITWTDTGANTNVAPDEDTAIFCEQADCIVLQADSTNANNTATDIDINVLGSLDGTNYDTVPYTAITSMGDGEVKTIVITRGPRYLKFRLDNNASGTTAYVTARVAVSSVVR